MRTRITQIVFLCVLCVSAVDLAAQCTIPSTVEIVAPDACRVYDEARRELLEYRIWRRWFHRWTRDLSTPIFDVDALGFTGLPLRIVERADAWDCDLVVAGYCTVGAYSFWTNTIEFSRRHYEGSARDVLRHELAHAAESFLGEAAEFLDVGHGTERDPFVKALRAWIGFLYELPAGHPYLPQLRAAGSTARLAIEHDGCRVRVKAE